ncbi:MULTISPECIES: DUF342 domain-containing protein [unclassified Ketobacter]|uniref:DUF342 domain-containing protein n=1 Tax=unclassified Ketobacter TaxID=2639109 RepID=UPI000F2470E3|nr:MULTISPECIES: FapA family protein [unclassified Ketobacter]RLT88911.1 MAG: DUF342 domain-containing protein [Ketobacter sp. GenoA1]RLT97051.1 MAG: DUF342 domain-containing protein [Ketobacter sp.]
MSGLRFEASPEGKEIQLIISKLDTDSLSVDFLRGQFKLTEFRDFYLLDSELAKALSQYKSKAVEPGNEDGLCDPIRMVVAEKREAVLNAELSEDKMSCSLIAETAFGAENPDFQTVKDFLTRLGVVKGLNESLLQSLCNKFSNVAPGTELREVVAKGKAPGQSRQAKIEILVLPVQDRLMKPKLRDDGTVDMHDFGEIEMVDIGDALLRRIPPVVGEPGYNVLGETVLAAQPQDKTINVGDGAEISPNDKNLLVASRRGVPLKIDSGMGVSDAYCVGDVDLETGNVDFDGTVVVQGSVREGMSVTATGKVLIRDYLESATVIAGDEVVIGKGVLGRQLKNEEAGEQFSVLIETPGAVFANYIQYAKIVAQGTVTAPKHIMHSDVSGTEVLVLSPKKTEGKIIGGIIRPACRLSCNTLGGPSYIPTDVDFSNRFSEQMADLESIRAELGERLNVVRGMKEALRQIKDRTGSDAGEQVAKISNTIAHFEGILSDLKQRREAILEAVNAIVETLEISVEKAVFPGVQITFIQNPIPVKQERDGCRIKAKGDGITYYSGN